MKTILISLILCISSALYSQDSVLVFHKKSPLPGIPRIESASFVIDSTFYIIGGLDSVNDIFREVWKYNISLDSWQRMRDFPGGPTADAGSFVLNGKGYVCAGLDSLYNHSNLFWEYDPGTDSWLQKSNFPGAARQEPVSFAYDNKGYVGLGFGTLKPDLWRYDPSGNQWLEMDSLPAPNRYVTSVTVIDSFAYLFGGYYAYIGGSTKDIWRYSLLGNKWELISSISGPQRGSSPIWSFNDFIIFAYGILVDSAGFNLLSDKYYFDIRNNTWHSMVFQNFVDSTADGISFAIGNTGYYFGGARSSNIPYSYYNDLWSFDATPLLATGIKPEIANEDFKAYPNPISTNGKLSISSPEEATLTFYNAIGQLLYTTPIHSGIDQINCALLHTDKGMIFYSTLFKNGNTKNGKLVILK